MLTNKTILVAAFSCLLILGIIFLGQSRQNTQPYSESQMLMDTLITIRAYSATAKSAAKNGFSVFVAVENMASFHKPESELAQLNRLGKIDATASFSQLIGYANSYHALSDGYFDPTFAALQKAYGFYDQKPRLPATSELQEILANHCGLSRQLRQDASATVTIASGAIVDFGGLAGGFAIELAASVMRNSGCSAFLIDDAGDIWFEGQKPDNKPWRVAVRDPRNNGILAFIESANPLAISTSGDYERYITVDGKRYGHIMNPHSGRPVDYYSSVTVVASSAVAADALSTAIFAMPPEKAFPWCDAQGLSVLFLTSSGSVYLSEAGRGVFSEVKGL